MMGLQRRSRFSLVAQFKAGFADDGRGICSKDDEMGISLVDALRQVHPWFLTSRTCRQNSAISILDFRVAAVA